MKKWLVTVIVLAIMLSLGGCCWPYYHHHGYLGDRGGYEHHDRGRDHNWERDRYRY
jgi:hypothetical protein